MLICVGTIMEQPIEQFYFLLPDGQSTDVLQIAAIVHYFDLDIVASIAGVSGSSLAATFESFLKFPGVKHLPNGMYDSRKHS